MKRYIQTYDQALDFIYSQIDFSFTKQQRYSEEVFNLDRMRHFMRVLGDPQNAYKTVHVAGTKGKGSISAMLASALNRAGYQIGFYSSPHMIDYTERIQVGNYPIPRGDFVDVLNELYPVIQEIYGLTTFEITTAVAFQYFKHQHIDIGVIEVGLGGRLDATNIIQPQVSVIASISLDHTAILGNTLEAIAAEKAGIIKPDIPVVISPQQPSVRAVFEEIAKERHAYFIPTGDLLSFEERHTDLERQEFDIRYPNGFLSPGNDQEKLHITLPLLGLHQMLNAGTAFCTLKVLSEQGIKVSDRDIIEGFKQVFWPGRFEILQKNPYLIIDAAHNLESSSRLVDTLEELFPDQKVTWIFGASEDKDISGMLGNFSKIASQIILTRSTHPRAADPVQMEENNISLGCDTIIIEDIQNALEYALNNAQSGDVIIASGSIFIAAAVREIWIAHHAEKEINDQ